MAFDPIAYVLAGGPIVSFIREASAITNLTPTAILRQLRASGLSIGTQAFYQVARYIRSEMRTGQAYVKNLEDDTLPDPSRLPRTATDRATNYVYTIQFTGKSFETGELDTQYVTLVSNRLLTKNQAISTVYDVYQPLQGVSTESISWDIGTVTNIQQNRAGLI